DLGLAAEDRIELAHLRALDEVHREARERPVGLSERGGRALGLAPGVALDRLPARRGGRGGGLRRVLRGLAALRGDRREVLAELLAREAIEERQLGRQVLRRGDAEAHEERAATNVRLLELGGRVEPCILHPLEEQSAEDRLAGVARSQLAHVA